MRQYASITLNMIAYAGIPEKTTSFPSEKTRWRQGCLKKQSAKYAIILNVSSIKHYQTFKMERFAKRITPECRYATRNYSGQGGEFCGTQALVLGNGVSWDRFEPWTKNSRKQNLKILNLEFLSQFQICPRIASISHYSEP